MAASEVSVVNDVPKDIAFEAFEFQRWKITEIQSLSDITIKIYFR